MSNTWLHRMLRQQRIGAFGVLLERNDEDAIIVVADVNMHSRVSASCYVAQ